MKRFSVFSLSVMVLALAPSPGKTIAQQKSGKKTDSGDPVSDADEGRVPRCKLCDWGV